jgi:lipoprotein-anchoring transpeptidase ErfK/SrfK
VAVAAVAAFVPFLGAPRAEAATLVPGTPCSVGTTACVSLGKAGYDARAWLIRNGKVVKGPISATSGGPGEDTPPGTYKVTSKDRDHVSTETRNSAGRPSEMPYSVFFGNRGYAFHGGGDPNMRTAGCVRLPNTDASYFFNNLAVGDTVQVTTSRIGANSGGLDNNDDSGDSGGGGGLLGGL